MFKIETERLLLRAWQTQDLEPFAKMNQDPKVAEFLGSALTFNKTKAFIESINQHFAEHGFGLWATTLKETKTFVGFVGLRLRTFEAAFTPCVEIGWRIDSDYWNKGYATEGAKAVLEIGFNTYNLEAIASWTAAINKASIRVMEKIGLIRDFNGDFYHPQLSKEHRLAKHLLYRLTADQYTSSADAMKFVGLSTS